MSFDKIKTLIEDNGDSYAIQANSTYDSKKKEYETPSVRPVLFTDTKIVSNIISSFITLLFDDRIDFESWNSLGKG